MNLSRCEKGHFYDKEKYASCPHCAQGVQSDESLTTVFTEDLNSDVGATEPLDTPTGAMGVNPPFPAQPMNVQPVQPMPPIQPVEAIQPVPPVMMPSADATETVASAGQPFPPSQPMDDEDDDHTVAFFDDIFSGAPSAVSTEPIAPTPASVMNPSAPQPVSPAPAKPTRVNTPCVGWLIALKGEHIGQDFRLKVGKNFIGRGSEMDVALEGEKSVSRNKHAIVVYEPKQHIYLVQPGESSELVYLNDNVVLSPTTIKEYDVISMGDVSLLFMPLCSERFNWTEVLKNR